MIVRDAKRLIVSWDLASVRFCWLRRESELKRFYGQEMDLETENKILLTIINFLKRFNYED